MGISIVVYMYRAVHVVKSRFKAIITTLYRKKIEKVDLKQKSCTVKSVFTFRLWLFLVFISVLDALLLTILTS